MATGQDHEPPAAEHDQSRADGFAAMGILALTVVFIVVVLIALI